MPVFVNEELSSGTPVLKLFGEICPNDTITTREAILYTLQWVWSRIPRHFFASKAAQQVSQSGEVGQLVTSRLLLEMRQPQKQEGNVVQEALLLPLVSVQL